MIWWFLEGLFLTLQDSGVLKSSKTKLKVNNNKKNLKAYQPV